MAVAMWWGFAVRFAQSMAQAAPFILVGLFLAGAFRYLIGPETTRRMFGGTSKRSVFNAWLWGMLLPVCSLGVIPVTRELRRMGLAGGTILAFAMSAPLFNPLSLLYGLTLSEPTAILAFAMGSLIVVTVVGVVWDRLFPHSEPFQADPSAPPPGLKRMLAIGMLAIRDLTGPSLGYMLIGLTGVGLMGALIPSGALQHSMNGDNPAAPLTMTAVAIPAYATPMLAMSQLGMMFQHANSPGAAFVLLSLGAGMNLGLAYWIFRQYGAARALGWFGLLLAVVIGLAYSFDRPLYPRDVEAADHTHAFDVYCRPFSVEQANMATASIEKLSRDIQPYEKISCLLLAGLFLLSLGFRALDCCWVIEDWLATPADPSRASRLDRHIPAPVLGGLALAGVIVASVVGCFAYYPPAAEALEEMAVVKTEALSGALAGDVNQAKYWIDLYDDWTRKLEVGVFLRHWKLSEYHHWKARLVREKLELLSHEVEEGDKEEIHKLIASISLAHSRMQQAFLEDR